MIIIRYLFRETIKSQVAIFFILILIFFSQKIINILSLSLQGKIPPSLIFPFLIFSVPEMTQLILPLSLFLGLMMTYSKFYINSEITVMHACGLGKKVLVITALILALFTTLVAAMNVTWILPWSLKYQEKLLAVSRDNFTLSAMIEGQFKTTKAKNIVFYVSNVKGKSFTEIFIAQLPSTNKQHPFVIIADSGSIREDKTGKQILVLDKGTRYEGSVFFHNFRITDFKDCKVIIDHKDTLIKGNKIEQKNMLELWHATDNESKAEFHWRLTLVVAVLIMSLMVVPFSEVNPRQCRYLSILPAIFLYLIFFLLQSALHFNAKRGGSDPKVMIWLVNTAFFLLSFILNILDTVFIRRLRAKFYSIKNFFDV